MERDRRVRIDQRPSKWPEAASYVWLALPLLALYCVSDSWTPLVVVFGLASLPGLLCLVMFVVLAVATALQICLKACERRAMRATLPQLQQQNIQLSSNRWWRNIRDCYLLSPRGEKMDLPIKGEPDFDALARQLSDQDAPPPRLKHYAMHAANIVYGEGKTRLAHIFSTFIDLTGAAQQPVRELTWIRDCSKDADGDAELERLALAGEMPRLDPPEQTEWERAVERYKACQRKAARHRFLDVLEYTSGHRIVRSGELGASAHMWFTCNGVASERTRIL